jgi:hypothetical protein
MINREYSAVSTAARASLKAGFNLAVTVAVLSHANAQLSPAPDVAIFLRNRQWNMPALYAYRAPETVMRSYFGDILGADMKKATVSRGFTNGRTLFARHSALVNMACDKPSQHGGEWSVADKCKALVTALAAEGVRTEADLQRFNEKPQTAKAEKTPLEKACAALANVLKHGADIPEFLALAENALMALQKGDAQRAAELLAAAGKVGEGKVPPAGSEDAPAVLDNAA